VLVVIPGAVTFGLALTEYDLIRSPSFIWFENFRDLWWDDVYWIALGNSLLFIVFAVPLRLLGALALALLMHKRFRGVSAYRTAGYMPTVVPDVAYALLFLWIFNPLYGPLNLTLDSLGAHTPAWMTETRSAQSAVIIMSLFTIGEGFIVAMATRQAIPSELYELGDLENAKPLYMFWRVTLPFMAPTLLLLLFRDTIFSFQVSFVPALLVTQGGPENATLYLPLFIYRHAFEYLHYGYAAAATVTMFLVTAVIVYAQYLIVKRWRHAFVV
jgi:multiple sugar transport system permease protein